MRKYIHIENGVLSQNYVDRVSVLFLWEIWAFVPTDQEGRSTEACVLLYQHLC